MKLISLNTWDGRILEPQLKFIKEQMGDTDIFCFQEVCSITAKVSPLKDFPNDLLTIFKDLLIDFNTIYFPCLEIEGFKIGLATAVKKNLKIVNSAGHVFEESKKEDFLLKGIQFLDISVEGKSFWLGNVHGVGHPSDKKDTQIRLNQSKIIISVLPRDDAKKILVGDFNLDIDTQSVRIIEEAGMTNLIKRYGITDTRGEVNHAKHPDAVQFYADYVFVSDGIKVDKFEVPQVKISDHLPLILEFK